MEAFCAHVLAVRNAPPGTAAEQWRQTLGLSNMLLPITLVRKEDLRNLVHDLPMGAQCKEYLCQKIELLKEGGDARWQDWSLINLYCTQELTGMWVSEPVASRPIETLIWYVLNWVQNMGLVKPSQQTFQAITCIILVVRDGSAWSALQKKELFDLVKTTWKRGHALGGAPTFIGNLPEPSKLQGLVSADWWVRALGVSYSSCNFVQHDRVAFDRVMVSIPMRNTRVEMRATQSSDSLGSPGPSGRDSVASIVTLLQGVMQSVQQTVSGAAPLMLQPTRPQPMLQPIQPLALLPPAVANGGPAMLEANTAAEDDATDDETPAQTVASAGAALSAGEQPMTLQDVAKALGAGRGKGKKTLGAGRGKGKKTKEIMKKPAVAAKTTMKKPAAAHHGARPNGCSKCRYKPGCTPSCIALKTKPA